MRTLRIVDVARTCHEANRALCAANGDDSQKPWDDAPNWQQSSAIQGVQTILDNQNITPAELHKAWCQMKTDEGWTYGDEKDVDAKTHPCLRPYDELPPEQRAKDHVFGAIVRALLPHIER